MSNGVRRNLEVTSTPELTADWWRRLREAQGAHYRASSWYRNIHFALGIVVIVTSTIALSFSFSGSTSKSLGILGVVAALAGSIQTFMQPINLSENHRLAAVRFADLRREIECFAAAYSQGEVDDPKAHIELISKHWADQLRRAPVIPRWIWLEGGSADSMKPDQNHDQ